VSQIPTESAVPYASGGVGATSQGAPAPFRASEGYKRYVLGLLFVVYVFNFVDRQIVSILGEPIKREFGLSDAQFGLLTGIAFAAVYSLLGVPMARWADRSSRKVIITLSLAFWSAMTALGGLATGFGTLALARLAVGVGEAGCSPPSHALLADYFPANQRGRAFSFYSMGIYAGILFGFVAGGLISEYFGWRWAFVVVGGPGVLLAVVVALTLREPPRGWADGVVATATPQPTTLQAMKIFWSIKSFRQITIASSLHTFVTYGVGAFVPMFLARSHGMGQAEIGAWLGPLYGFGGMTGTLLGGYLSDKLSSRDRRWPVWIGGFSVLCSVPLALVSYLSPNITIVLAITFPSLVLSTMYLGPALATLQGLAGLKMRAMCSAIFFLFINLIGNGIGPWVTGLISDGLTPFAGRHALRYALAIMVLVNVWSWLHYMLAARSLRADWERRVPAAG
jgi:predicted MFS family arabinose efflux permease